MEDSQTRCAATSATSHVQEVIINVKCRVKVSWGSPLLVRSGQRVDVEVKLQTQPLSNQMDFHLSYISSTHLQLDAEIKVARENKKEQDSKEAETEVSKSQIPKCF